MTHGSSRTLSQFLEFKNGKTSPSRNDDGSFAVFGSNGEIGRSESVNGQGPLIVIGRVGSYCGSLFYSESDAWVTDNAIICSSKESSDVRYWYYALLTLALNGRSSGSGQPLLNQGILGSIHFDPPELTDRQAIAEVLGALDDKIAANTKLLSTADQLSHAIFRSMSQTSGQMIPLSETAEFVNGKAFTKNANGTGRVVIRIAELNSGISGSTVYNDIDVDDQHLARPGDLLFAWSGSLTLHRWFRPEGIINQHIFKVIPKTGYPVWLVHELLRHKLEEFKAIAADKATTMGHIQRKHLDELVAAPAPDVILLNNELMAGLWRRALAAEVESTNLAAMRDTLLPQLISGKLQVRDAEKVLEEAGV
ncbi:restriction endonuclease subunit S [Arthrobacter sp. OAP107]|uniref:restriction endonuclease subunit S n=1 Tax=Arthrobacter sp. OAP107 TaxID=3156445 RepID=UPI003396DDEA